MKKIMFLGGNYFQATAIRTAKALGYYVITVDYLPKNPGHKYADKYYNISTLDSEQILAVAEKERIDGILSYASDVSAPTAAYVALKLGLPTNPLESVKLLTDKQRFRVFLHENGFNTPRGECFSSYDEAEAFYLAMHTPVIVKPTDASGSKGVHKVTDITHLKDAWKDAMHYSRNKKIFVEEFIEKSGYEIDADSFLVNGKFAYFGVMDQHNDILCNPFVPVGLSGPSILARDKREKAKKELQRLMSLLNMKMGAFNIEYIFDENDDLYILEVGPRNGGNLISDTILLGSGVDLAKFSVLAAVGEPLDGLHEKPFYRCVSSYIIHSEVEGIYEKLEISQELAKDLLRLEMFIKPGERVHRYENGSLAIGAAIIQFPEQHVMNERLDHMSQFLKVILRK